MKEFSMLLENLFYTYGNLAKEGILLEYFKKTPDPERGYALAVIVGELKFKNFKRNLVKELMSERVDPVLFELSYDYVGEMSETIAHLWPNSGYDENWKYPELSELIDFFNQAGREESRTKLIDLLDHFSSSERWALLKLGSSGLRIGISARFAKKVLANWAGVDSTEIEEIWHGLKAPYIELFDWIEGRGEKPEPKGVNFWPVMLAHPLEQKDFKAIKPDEFVAEWKFDGIRVQLSSLDGEKKLFSRTGDDIGHSFPDLLSEIDFHGVFDGELLIKIDGEIASFNSLQQRLNKKSPSKKLMANFPAHVMLYDALRIGDQDLRELDFNSRRLALEKWFKEKKRNYLSLSEFVAFNDIGELDQLRTEPDKTMGPYVEGLMLKKKLSPYIPGRPKGHWYKWKRDPKLVDAVLMYAQRGHGRRSSYYSDFTFGLWSEEKILPIGKAYFGFTDEELMMLDKWIRKNTLARFGPVREVEKKLVFEVAFDSVARSGRHKSGFALRFPRISRIRWDKPSNEADQLEILEGFLND